MISFKASDLHRQAQERLQQATAPKRLVLVHALVALGSTLLIAGLNYLFSLLIADTGGLSGMGTRTILSTVQTLLETVMLVALPFWQMGLIFIVINWARNIHAGTDGLLQGFRRVGPILAFRLLYILLLVVLFFALLYPCSMVFVMTPFANPFMEEFGEEFSPLMDPTASMEQIEALFTPERIQSMAHALAPLYIFFGILYFSACVILFYRLRLGEFALMDGFGGGSALLHSFRTTKGAWRYLVKLDLHFWWFYALQVLCNIIGNGNWLLPYLGIHLPLSETAAYFLFFGLGTALQILFLWLFQGQVLTSYAVLYNALSQPQVEPVLEQA